MGFRFRRSFRILPGVRLNITPRGTSVSAGIRGAHVTISDCGTRTTVGLPGTGASYSEFTPAGDRPPLTSGEPSAGLGTLLFIVMAAIVAGMIWLVR